GWSRAAPGAPSWASVSGGVGPSGDATNALRRSGRARRGRYGDRVPTPDHLPPPLQAIEDEVVACRACPRLVEWRERVAREKRAAYADEEYWGRPVPGF